MILKRLLATIGVASALIWSAGVAPAATVGIAGGRTAVEVTAPLGALGLTAAPFGSATASGAVFTFPITGGSIDTDTGAAVIRHDGSGVSLTAGAKSAFVGNFVIDTGLGQVLGDAAAFGFGAVSGVALFDLAAGETRGVPLLISQDLAGILDGYFGAAGLEGATFGYARPEIAPVPLPAGVFLILGAVAALGVAGRRRSA